MRELLLFMGMMAMAATNRNDYLNQYQQFRSAYADYTLNKNQYTNAPTFAHEEQLVSAAKIMLTERAKLWLSYWQVLTAEVGENQGISETERTELADRLNQTQTELSAHQQAVAVATTRAELNEQAKNLNDQKYKYEGISYITLDHINQGRLRVAIRELKVFAENVKQATQNQIRETEEREARLRGIEEVIQMLSTQEEQANKPIKTLEQYNRSHRASEVYQDAVEVDLQIYTQIKQAYNLLKELGKEIEL